MPGVQAKPSKWGPIALVCKKCGKKLHGGFGTKGKHALADTLSATLKQGGRRRAIRVVESGCLGICPKGAVALALNDRVLLVEPGTDPEAVIAAIAPAPPAPPPPLARPPATDRPPPSPPEGSH